MGNPFYPRFIKRFLVFLACFFGCLIVGGILNSFFIFFLAIPMVVAVPAYFYWKDNKEKNSCIELIRNNYSENSLLTVDAYHNNLEWGYLSMTNESLVFIPKKGDTIRIPLNTVSNYGFEYVGTGEYTTTMTRVGNTNLSVGSTREAKCPVFYVYVDDSLFIWQTKKHEKMFNTFQKLQGKDTSNLKSNY